MRCRSSRLAYEDMLSAFKFNLTKNTNKMKWNKFKPLKAANRQKLPKEKKYVLVRIRNLTPGLPNPIVVGWLKYHAGVKSEPYFVTPGANINKPKGDGSTIEWCDCLPGNFEWGGNYYD